jgi:hypothetical protein
MTVYTNLLMYNFDMHQVRLTFFDKGQRYGQQAVPNGESTEQVAELVMTRQTFRAFLEILNGMAQQMPPISVHDQDKPPPADAGWHNRGDHLHEGQA